MIVKQENRMPTTRPPKRDHKHKVGTDSKPVKEKKVKKDKPK